MTEFLNGGGGYQTQEFGAYLSMLARRSSASISFLSASISRRRSRMRWRLAGSPSFSSRASRYRASRSCVAGSIERSRSSNTVSRCFLYSTFTNDAPKCETSTSRSQTARQFMQLGSACISTYRRAHGRHAA